MSSNWLVFYISGEFHQDLLFFIWFQFFLVLSWVLLVGPSFMSNCLLKIFVIRSCVTFGRYPSKFSKCCFHRCIRSCWLVAFSLSFAVLFLLLISFTVCHAILDCLSSTKSLILSIWFCMYSVVLLGRFQLIPFVPFLSFSALVLVGSFLLHSEAVFMPACSFLTANVSHWALGLVLCLVGKFHRGSMWALTKFSSSTFGVCVSVFSYSASNLFLSVNAYLSLIFQL